MNLKPNRRNHLTVLLAVWLAAFSVAGSTSAPAAAPVPLERFKIITFVLSAGLTGLAGAVYAYALGYFTAGSVFRVDFSLNMILHAMLGGIGTLTGPVIGAALLVFVTNVLLGRLLDLHHSVFQ